MLGHGHPHDAMVVLVAVLDDEARCLGSIDETDRAVVTQQEVLGHIADRREFIACMAADGEHELVLRRGDAGSFGLLLAPLQEPTQCGAQGEQLAIVLIRNAPSHVLNISFHDMTVSTKAFRERLTQRLLRWSIGNALVGDRHRLWRLVVVVGVMSGLVGAAYIAALKGLTRLLGAERWSDGPHLIVLAVTGVAIAGLTFVLGNPGDVELLVDNIHVSGGKSDMRELRSLIPISLIGIAAGSAIGPEAPLVQTTGSIGSWLALRYRLTVTEVRVLTITGMAAGFAMLFGAPLGAAIFALEILHRRGLQYYEALLPSVIGALSGYAVYIVVNGTGLGPVWNFPEASNLHASDLLIGVAAGIVGAGVAIAFTYFARFERAMFGRVPVTARPVLGGLAIGALAVASPYALTFGEGQIGFIVGTKLAISTLLLAALVKFVASATIVSAGWRGGFIIPLFFIGAAVGIVGARAFGVDQIIAVTAMMTAVNVGVTKTPFGSSLVVAEMAGLRLLPPTLLAAVIALFLTSRVSMIHTQRERAGATGAPVDLHGPSTHGTGENGAAAAG